jgi:hypothetical protein
MGCYLLSEAAIAIRRVTVAPSMHEVRTFALWGVKSIQNDPFSTFQVKSKRNSGRVSHNVTIHRDIWQPWWSPKIYDTVAILQGTKVNCTYYRSCLACSAMKILKLFRISLVVPLALPKHPRKLNLCSLYISILAQIDQVVFVFIVSLHKIEFMFC